MEDESKKPEPEMIECIRIRDGGTFASIDGETYHFAPQPDGRHVAAVSNPRHVTRFLEIAAYRRCADRRPAVPQEPAKEPAADDGAQGADGGQGDVQGATDLAAADEDELRVIFEKEVGRKPSSRALRETLIAQIEQARAAG